MISFQIENPNYQIIDEGLRINQVSMSDNETFWCRADVLETGESRDHSITVIVSSKFFLLSNINKRKYFFLLLK